MRILTLGDLHARQEWFAWVKDRISVFDLTALPGDFTNGFQKDYESQKEFIREWMAAVAKLGKPVAWCSGNHDMTRWIFAQPDRRFGSCWTDGLLLPSVVGDLDTRAFKTNDGESYVVTSLPDGGSQKELWKLASEKALEPVMQLGEARP